MSTTLDLMKMALKWFNGSHLAAILFPTANAASIKHRILLTSSVGVACIITTDFVYGYQRLSSGNTFVQSRMRRNSLNYAIKQLTTGDRINRKRNKISPISLTQSSTELSTFKSPLFFRTQLSLKDWLFQYFYQTRLNLYTNAFLRYIDIYYINYSRRHVPNLQILGKLLIEAPSFFTMIDPPNLKRHEYAFNKLGITNRKNIIFFSDVNVCIPYKNGIQLLQFIEICCEITDNHECVPLFWRLNCDKSGYFEMGDLSMNTEGFMTMVMLWAALKVHVLCHVYGAKIILKNNKHKHNKNDFEMKKLDDDFRTAETSMIALNHVACSTAFVFNMTEYELRGIISTNSSNMVWKHSTILQNELLQNLKVVHFMSMARKQLLRIFSKNNLHRIYDFEAAFLCIVCHGIDHYAMKNVNYFHFRSNFEMGIPDLIGFVTLFGSQNKPLLRESRLKYLAKSKILRQFSNYLDSVDSELSNCVNLINST